jgi:hypothetical protein
LAVVATTVVMAALVMTAALVVTVAAKLATMEMGAKSHVMFSHPPTILHS